MLALHFYLFRLDSSISVWLICVRMLVFHAEHMQYLHAHSWVLHMSPDSTAMQIGAETHELWSAELRRNVPTHLWVTSWTPCRTLGTVGVAFTLAVNPVSKWTGKHSSESYSICTFLLCILLICSGHKAVAACTLLQDATSSQAETKDKVCIKITLPYVHMLDPFMLFGLNCPGTWLGFKQQYRNKKTKCTIP